MPFPSPSPGPSQMKHRGCVLFPDFPGCGGQTPDGSRRACKCWGNLPTCWGGNSCHRSSQSLRLVAWYHRREVPTHGMSEGPVL